MKNTIILFVSFLLMSFYTQAQVSVISKEKLMKLGSVDAVTITLDGQSKNVKHVLDQRIAAITGGKAKSKKKKGAYIFEGVVATDIARKTIDIYYTLDDVGKKNEPRTKVSLFLSLGNESIMNYRIYKDELENSTEILDDLPQGVRVYELELAIEEQLKTIQKAQKDYANLGKDSLSLEQTLIQTQDLIEKNIFNREENRKVLKTEEQSLEEYKALLEREKQSKPTEKKD